MNNEALRLSEHLTQLRLSFLQENHQTFADQGAREQWTHLQYLGRLLEGETQRRQDRCIVRRIAAARFPVIKTLDQFNWNWPKKINRAQVQHLFSLSFLKDKASVIFVGGVGLGKSHLAVALGHAACLQGHSVLFTTAVEAINTLSAAQAQCRLKAELKKFLSPTILVCDELGYLPIDKAGADLLFQIISGRYEKGSTVITTNQTYKNWGNRRHLRSLFDQTEKQFTGSAPIKTKGELVQIIIQVFRANGPLMNPRVTPRIRYQREL